MAWHGRRGIDPISGLDRSRPDAFYTLASPEMWCSRQEFWLVAATGVGCSGNLSYDGTFVELSAWPSFDEAGELRNLPVAGNALPWHG